MVLAISSEYNVDIEGIGSEHGFERACTQGDVTDDNDGEHACPTSG